MGKLTELLNNARTRARELGLPYLYLGYWIAESRKMSYKSDFRPIEGLIDGQWTPLPASTQLPNQKDA